MSSQFNRWLRGGWLEDYQVQALSGKVDAGQPSREVIEGVPVRRIPWSRRKWLRFLRTPFDLFRALHAQRDTYDVIHLHQHSWFGLFTIVAARLLGKPILTKLPNVGAFGMPGLLAKRLGRLRLAILLRSDAVVAMAQESLSELEDVGFPPDRILGTPNGIRLEPKQRVVNPTREPAPSCRVVFVGRLSEEKRIDTLLSSWQEVIRTANESAALELWGSGSLEAELRQLSQKLKISDSVTFRGHVDDVRRRLATMDIFVLPSCAEGNSNAILEAMAAGLPIVSTRVGGTPMLVGTEGADLLFDVGDRDALAAHLIKLIQDSVLRKRVGASMRYRTEEFFAVHRVARTYADAYHHLAAGQRDRVSEVSHPVIRDSQYQNALKPCVG